MKNNPTLPCSIAELQEMDVDWKAVTNDFDFDKVNSTIKLWKNYGERRTVARMIGFQMSVDNLKGISADSIQPVLDLLNMYRYEEGSDKYLLMKEHLRHEIERYKRTGFERLKEENKNLKSQVEKLKEELKAEKELVGGRTRELDKYFAAYENGRKEIIFWRSEYENKEKENEKLKNENNLLKELVQEKGADQKFSVKQTTIIAYALCKKADVLPKNKKNISQLFSRLTGRSANTLGQNLCSTYTDKEIDEIATTVEKEMPVFAAYLREKTFYLPEKKKVTPLPEIK